MSNLFESNTPYNNLPPLPPLNSKWESLDIYKQLSKTTSALAELRGRLAVISNPKILINTLVLQEAKESSSIENIFTTSDKLFKAFSSTGEPDSQTKEVLLYRQALWSAWQSLKSSGLSVDLMESIYRTIKNADDGIRENEVYIGNQWEVIYTPPNQKAVILNKLENWIAFANENDEIDPLIKMALLHYQFEAIHPFIDGNGRTGRILNVLYLSSQNLLEIPVLYLSKFINENKDDYYRCLLNVTKEENWTDWILFMLKSVQFTANRTLKKVNDIDTLFKKTTEIIKEKTPKIYSFELADLLFHQPYCKIGYVVKAEIASRNTAGKYLNELEKINILKKEKVGNEQLYQNIALYELLSK